MRFKGHKVLITGATSGIGLATAARFIEEGATVIGIGRNFERTKELGDKFIPCVCDVTNEEQLNAAVEFVDKTFGGELDVFVSNAGHGFMKDLIDVRPADINAGINLILNPTVFFGVKLYPMLLKGQSKNPCIINVSSSSDRQFNLNNVPYCLSKTALVKYTKLQAVELKGVRCNSVSPGFTDTPIFTREGADLTRKEADEWLEGVKGSLPTHRIGKPEDLASAITFLCSEDAKYITGANLLCDGGATLRFF